MPTHISECSNTHTIKESDGVDFVPLLEEPALPLRGHHINSLIQARSQSFLPSTLNSGKRDIENGLSQTSHNAQDLDRTKSTKDRLASDLQGRSQRLIGDSNPRYDWYACLLFSDTKSLTQVGTNTLSRKKRQR